MSYCLSCFEMVVPPAVCVRKDPNRPEFLEGLGKSRDIGDGSWYLVTSSNLEPDTALPEHEEEVDFNTSSWSFHTRRLSVVYPGAFSAT